MRKVIPTPSIYAAACAVARAPRCCACSAAVCSQPTIGVAAAVARSLPGPVHTALRDTEERGQFGGLGVQGASQRLPARCGLQHRRRARSGHQPRGVQLGGIACHNTFTGPLGCEFWGGLFLARVLPGRRRPPNTWRPFPWNGARAEFDNASRMVRERKCNCG